MSFNFVFAVDAREVVVQHNVLHQFYYCFEPFFTEIRTAFRPDFEAKLDTLINYL